MLRKSGLILLIALLGATAHAAALKADTQEFRAGGVFEPTSVAGSHFSTDLTYGYFVADEFEVGGHIKFSHDDASSLFGAGPFIEYNFDLGSEFVPFVGVALDFASGDAHDQSRSAFALTGFAGGKFFLTENIAIGARIEMSVATDKIYANTKSSDSTDVGVIFGMSYYLP